MISIITTYGNDPYSLRRRELFSYFSGEFPYQSTGLNTTVE
jgi:hypothetical protein